MEFGVCDLGRRLVMLNALDAQVRGEVLPSCLMLVYYLKSKSSARSASWTAVRFEHYSVPKGFSASACYGLVFESPS